MREVKLGEILRILKQKGYASVEELSRELGVSPVTVRRYLSILESQGLLERKRGGAVAKNIKYDLPFFLKLDQRKDEKIRIARKALQLLESGQTVFSSGGTTVYYTLQAIDETNLHDLTIVTNSITSAWAVVSLRKPLNLIHTGGVVRQGSFECIGGHVLEFIERLNIDVMLLGVDGIHPEKGVSFSNYEESVIARRIMERSSKVVVLADSSKIGMVAPYSVSLSLVDYLVTTYSGRELEEIAKAGVKVIPA